jgi:ribosomal protein L40E
VQSERRGSRGANRVEEVPPAEKESDGQEAERRFARRVARVTPMATLVAAAIVGTLTSIGPAILVLAGGALFATIGFFWASMRTLGGDAPLADGFDTMTRRRVEASDSPAERKRAALRALKDLEFEHSIGKIDDDDYAEIGTRYREQAKGILREMEERILPLRDRAEQVARAYLAKQGFATEAGAGEIRHKAEGAPHVEVGVRMACARCNASNEPDAVFCKGCGARLAPQGCPNCSSVNEGDAAFCKKCGSPLVSSTSPENADASD